jgi:hypothetical protein
VRCFNDFESIGYADMDAFTILLILILHGPLCSHPTSIVAGLAGSKSKELNKNLGQIKMADS